MNHNLQRETAGAICPKKIIDIKYIADTLAFLRPHKKVVQCHGVFDLLHIGHIKHLQQAKNFGDILVVTLTTDAHVNKGVGRPYFTEMLRAEALAALSCVDYVVINPHATAIEAIQRIKPDFYAKGDEYDGIEHHTTVNVAVEKAAVESFGGQFRYTKDIIFSSSHLLNRFFSAFSPEVNVYLDRFKMKYTAHDVLSYLEKSEKLNLLLIGEAIIDIYHYGEALGKSGKEPILATQYHREQKYIGGVLAIANHLASFCHQVTCVTLLGEQGEYESFIRNHLKKNVIVDFHYKKASPTIVKRRYIDDQSSQKLFEIYEMNDHACDEEQKAALATSIEEKMTTHDAVIVADYGHGLLDNYLIQKLESHAPFLAVNTQANAGNHGMNCISKYQKANYVCLAYRELQLYFREKHGSALEHIKQLMHAFQYKNILITKGIEGSFLCGQDEMIHETPAFIASVKDRVGAGDALFAITSLFVIQNAPQEMVGFIGNVVGMEAVNIVGHERFIEKIPLMKQVMHMLK